MTIFPTYPNPLLKPSKGKGVYIWDESGKQYIDFTSGIGVNQLGHVPETVKVKIVEQLERIWHTSNLFEIEPQLTLAKKLTEISGLDYVFFGNSGAEANEAAIKLARKYQQKVKRTKRYEVITFQKSFHGRTLATLTATGQEKVKGGFNPLPKGFVTVPFNDLTALEKAITKKTAAIMLEVIQGEGGILLADETWLVGVEKLAKKNDLLLIIDEVQTGVGRTGKWFGFQNYPIHPDIITLAKGLGNGIPIGAMIGNKKTMAAFEAGSHGSTFGGNFIATAAAIATIDTIEQDGILNLVKQHGDYLQEKLEGYLSKLSSVVEIRGKGLMIGIELNNSVSELVQISKEEGVLVLTAGTRVIRLLPPLNVTKEELDDGIEKLARSVEAFHKQKYGVSLKKD